MSRYEPESLPEIASAALAELEQERERQRLARDDGEIGMGDVAATREKREKERSRACMRRLEDGSWCILPHAHTTGSRPVPCSGIAMQYGPALPPADRKVMSAFRAEISEKYDDKAREREWTDRFGARVPPMTSPAQQWMYRVYQRR